MKKKNNIIAILAMVLAIALPTTGYSESKNLKKSLTKYVKMIVSEHYKGAYKSVRFSKGKSHDEWMALLKHKPIKTINRISNIIVTKASLTDPIQMDEVRYQVVKKLVNQITGNYPDEFTVIKILKKELEEAVSRRYLISGKSREEIHRQQQINFMERDIVQMSEFELSKEDMLIRLKAVLKRESNDYGLTEKQVSAFLNDQLMKQSMKEELQKNKKGKSLSEEMRISFIRKRTELLYEAGGFSDDEILKILLGKKLDKKVRRSIEIKAFMKKEKGIYTMREILRKNPSEAEILQSITLLTKAGFAQKEILEILTQQLTVESKTKFTKGEIYGIMAQDGVIYLISEVTYILRMGDLLDLTKKAIRTMRDKNNYSEKEVINHISNKLIKDENLYIPKKSLFEFIKREYRSSEGQ